MYITNNNNCWYTNIGEAFIDIGVKNIFKNISKDNKNIIFNTISPMSKFYIGNMYAGKEILKNVMDPADWIKTDLFILPGMFGSIEFVKKSFSINMARKLKENGSEIAFLGFGACEYTEQERKIVLEAMQQLKPLFVITRDDKTYQMYKDYVNCIKGLDCAFWVNDNFNPAGMSLIKEYIVSTFNRSDEPENVANVTKNLIHPWHMPYYLNKSKTRFLAKENLMVSDNPYDYITLYANAKTVYTDLVHATIISLLYNTPVKYYKIDNRRDAFESVKYLKYDKDGFMSIDNCKLNEEKKEIEKIINVIIKNKWRK